MSPKTVVEAFEVGMVENAMCQYHNQAFIDLFETIAQIIKEIRRERK